MIILSWPTVGVGSPDFFLDLVAKVGGEGEMNVSVRRETRGLTGEDIVHGHECLYRGGMWTVRKSGPDVLESVTRRNVSVKDVVSFLLADMQSHSMCYRIPPEVLEGALSVERMDELCLAVEVIGS